VSGDDEIWRALGLDEAAFVDWMGSLRLRMGGAGGDDDEASLGMSGSLGRVFMRGLFLDKVVRGGSGRGCAGFV